MFNSFFGGINGDGDFSGCGRWDSEESYGFAPSLYPIEKHKCQLTGITTKKAVQLIVDQKVLIWLPKKLMSSPHYDHFTSFGKQVFYENLRKETLKLNEHSNI